jgi:hypothetical protein
LIVQTEKSLIGKTAGYLSAPVKAFGHVLASPFHGSHDKN